MAGRYDPNPFDEKVNPFAGKLMMQTLNVHSSITAVIRIKWVSWLCPPTSKLKLIAAVCASSGLLFSCCLLFQLDSRLSAFNCFRWAPFCFSWNRFSVSVGFT
ncbi:unnamed protein product [Ilex paraguariensis]|uniref:Uncharacterized protein n=1 Tax=Ilex paraguariensis TaxID=185542 RepID=A0ABC8V5R3_9AQUA